MKLNSYYDLFLFMLRHSLHLDFVERRLQIAIQGSVLRFPGELIIVDPREHMFRGRVTTIRQNIRGLDQPVFPVVCPSRFPKAPVAIENPGSNLSAFRIPADNLPPVSLILIASFHLERAGQKILVACPLDLCVDGLIPGLVLPSSN